MSYMNNKKNVNRSKRIQKRNSFSKKNQTKRKSWHRKRRSSKRSNQRLKRRSNRRLNRRRNRRGPCGNEMKGGAIPFSELGLAYDNIKFGINSASTPFKDDTVGVPNNTLSKNIDPNPTKQFLSTRSLDQSILGPNLKGIHETYFV